MKKLIYSATLVSVLILGACGDVEPPIPEDKSVEWPVYEGEPIEAPQLSDEN